LNGDKIIPADGGRARVSAPNPFSHLQQVTLGVATSILGLGPEGLGQQSHPLQSSGTCSASRVNDSSCKTAALDSSAYPSKTPVLTSQTTSPNSHNSSPFETRAIWRSESRMPWPAERLRLKTSMTVSNSL
jgi:hypothetical protein